MTIKKLANQLQPLIDKKMKEFDAIGKQAKEMRHKLEEYYHQMSNILKEIEPVDSLVRAQNPEKCALFDELIKIRETK